MTAPSRIRRIGWFAALGICLALYAMLHIKVTSVHADVVRAEQQIVQLEEQKLLLETELLTRANQVQLAAWNRVDFGFQAPAADQFIEGPRQLASYGAPPSVDAPAPIRLAGMRSVEDVPEFPQIVSRLTGRPIDANLLEEEAEDDGRLAVTVAPGPLRMPIAGVSGAVAEATIR
ncbi:hypothetical protein [Aurantiacibacter sediminis]|uniref:Cell division protein FtsL n=1 Tax=Aurantiacibacter sediminis TaxID=2793064 RepID=A0ABS0N692_9SPHN|nr:hypothetical protein [Aurantiacibacter sediminis]MBH5323286.1 hypothetical protein [Aurantiacibacter sediminis]